MFELGPRRLQREFPLLARPQVGQIALDGLDGSFKVVQRGRG